MAVALKVERVSLVEYLLQRLSYVNENNILNFHVEKDPLVIQLIKKFMSSRQILDCLSGKLPNNKLYDLWY